MTKAFGEKIRQPKQKRAGAAGGTGQTNGSVASSVPDSDYQQAGMHIPPSQSDHAEDCTARSSMPAAIFMSMINATLSPVTLLAHQMSHIWLVMLVTSFEARGKKRGRGKREREKEGEKKRRGKKEGKEKGE